MESPTQNFHLIYCDGACSGNPGPGGWGAVVRTVDGKISELGGDAEATTNNRMEITAVMESLRFLSQQLTGESPAEVKIFTDSRYVINGITQWVYGWQKKNWMTATGTPVVNRELWEALLVVWKRIKAQTKVTLDYVPGHSGIAGNERADEIATSFAKKEGRKLFQGEEKQYDLRLLPPSAEAVAAAPKKKKGAKAMGYLSLVDGKARRHETWAECEKRVKGKAKALYRKYSSADEESQILRAWGVSPDSIS